MNEGEKLAWLRSHINPNIPDIYAVPGFVPNGCGPAGLMNRLIPDRFFLLWGVDLDPNGDLHDYRYWVGGNEFQRKMADMEFRQGILAWRRDLAWWRFISRERLTGIAEVYYRAVREFGEEYFNYKDATDADAT